MAKGINAIAAAVALAAGMAVDMAGTARAAELCVACTGPDARYACVIDGAGEAPDSRLTLYCMTELAKAGGHASCSVERAKSAPCQGDKKLLANPNPGGIPSDSAAEAIAAPDAATSEGTAPALPKPADPLTATQAPAPLPAGQPAVTEIPKSGTPPQTAEQPKTAIEPEAVKEPKTVEEMVKKGTETAGKELQDGGKAASEAAGNVAQSAGGAVSKAGKAVGDAAKKTWTCITSLFGSC